MITVHFDTFKVTGQRTLPSGNTYDLNSVEITIKGVRREVRCSGVWNGHLAIWDLAVRFQTGTKVWPGQATYWIESGRVNNLRPDIDKRGHVSLVGFFADYAGKDTIRSLHNAVA